MSLLGVDTGGTFTDLIYFDGRALRVHKVLSTPHAPEVAILRGIDELGLELQGLEVVHGSTVATNALLEGKGVRTAYIANHGLGDVLSIGRQARRELYNLQPTPTPPPVPAELCLETGGRLSAEGAVIEALGASDLAELTAQLEQLRPQAVAINLLFSFLDDRFERQIEAAVPDGIFVSRSSAVLPEYREYERGIATWLNSYIGPIMHGYLQRLHNAIPGTSVKVMQSHGDTISAQQAGEHAVNLLLSGPAGGLMGARYVAAASDISSLLTLDMGGTSTDVALIDGPLDESLRLSSESVIAGYPVAVPMVDMHTIGAGGGSIAHVDEGGLLRVGPESAGAAPGPACYAQGGQLPTVTDANLILGRLPANTRLGGGMPLDMAAARGVLAGLADQLKLDIDTTAEGIIRIANQHMAQALRVISVQRGLNPAAYTLVSFGGAGGLHVCDLAEELGMRQALVPIHAGVLSALGMLVAPQGRQFSQTLGGVLNQYNDEDITAQLQRLAERGRNELAREAVDSIQAQYTLDLRYLGQSSTLNVAWQGVTQSASAFHEQHHREFGHAHEMPVELVNIRVGLHADTTPPQLPQLDLTQPAEPVSETAVHGIDTAVPVFERSQLMPQQRLQGPVLITENVATTLVKPHWDCKVDATGNLLLRR